MKDLDFHPWSPKPCSFSLFFIPLLLLSISALLSISVCLSLSFTPWLRTEKDLVMIISQACWYHLCGFSRLFSSRKRFTKQRTESCLISPKHPYLEAYWRSISSLSIGITFSTNGRKQCGIVCIEYKIMIPTWSFTTTHFYSSRGFEK